MTSNKVPAVIIYQKPGARPPIFVAGTFSDPSWQPHEMDYEVQGDGELLFKKEFEGESGSEVQYKFRIGEGDWWDLQQSQRTVTDSAGNTNHVMEIGSSSEPTTLSPTNGEVSTNEQDQKQEEPEEQAASNPVKPSAPRVQALSEEEIPTRSGTSTPVFAKVAAEVADSAELLHEDVPDREPAQGSIQVQSSSKPIKPSDSQLQSIMNEEIRTGSGTGTPVTARVAAEVADSAALLNEDVPDRVSLNSGIRELEPTPMTDDATTAAKVADTARTLDRVDEILLSSPPLDDVQPFSPSDEPDNYLDHKPPLFAHELAGVSSPESELRELDPEDEHLHADKSPIEDIDPDDVDLNDPTLERFPSNREEIIDTVRKLETSLNEDQASFDGAPPSPVMNSPSNGVQDVTDCILADNTPTPVVSLQPSKHLDVPRSPHGSAGSPLSLQSITEAEEPEELVVEDDSATQPAVVFTNTDLKPKPSHLGLGDGIEDAGVASKDSVSPRTAISAAKIVAPEGSPMARQAELVSESRTSPSSQSLEVNETGSGVQSLQDKQTAAAPSTPVPNQFDDASRAGKGSPPAQESETGEGSAEASSVVTPAIQSEAADSATATGAEVNGELQQARKRATQQAEEVPTVTSPISTRPTGGVQPEQGGNWLHAFFRVLFVDWIGGFISKICGTSRRNTT